jgi:hypothetical protein
MDDKQLALLFGILKYLDNLNLQEDNLNLQEDNLNLQEYNCIEDAEIFSGCEYIKLKNKKLIRCILN